MSQDFVKILRSKTIVLICSLAALTLGVDRLWIPFLSSGTDVGLKESDHELQSEDTLLLQTNYGDIRGYFNIELDLDTAGYNANVYRPGRTPGGYGLALDSISSDGIRCWYMISDPKLKDSADSKFLWPSGHVLSISRLKKTGALLKLGQWRLFIDKSTDDSSQDVFTRRVSGYLFVFTFLCSAFGLGSQIRESLTRRKKKFMIEDFLEKVIDSIELSPTSADSDERVTLKIELIRKTLRLLVCEEYDTSTVWNMMQIPVSQKGRHSFKALDLMRDKLNYFDRGIHRALERLEEDSDQ